MNSISTSPASPRQCGDCALCCHLGEIVDFKPYNQWCQHCSTQRKCDIYEARPALCREFHCLYLLSDLGEEWRPNHCGMIVSVRERPNRITVLVEPEQSLRWREAPYLAQLIAWAQTHAVTVMVGHAAYAICPDRIEALGETTQGRSVVIHEQVMQSGAVRYVQALHST